jgi:tetratricopeptide (TPR) repeat protein
VTTPEPSGRDDPGPGPPSVDESELSERVYEWYQRASQLHAAGRPAQAAELLARALAVEPNASCLRDALARAQFDAEQFLGARTSFSAIVAIDPVNDYALFGLGLSESRLGDFASAADHLALAVAMRPDDSRYLTALEQALATLRSRAAPMCPPSQSLLGEEG